MAMLVITKGKSKETYTYTMVIWVYENNPEKKTLFNCGKRMNMANRNRRNRLRFTEKKQVSPQYITNYPLVMTNIAMV